MQSSVTRERDDELFWDMVTAPKPGRVYGMRFYLLTFGACSWTYFIGRHLAPEVRKLMLQRNGRLPIAKLSWIETRYYREYRAALQRQRRIKKSIPPPASSPTP